MHAAARAKTPRTKPAADPWQALPGLADLFDSQTPQPFFKGSKVYAREELALTETKLLEQTASILGISLAQLVKAGTLVYAKREFLNHNKYSAAEGGDSESALLRSGSGVAGVADARILAAYQAMAGANPPIPITPAKLATRALTGYLTALRWLKTITPNYWSPSPTRPPLLPWPSLLSRPSSPLNQNPHLKPSYRNSLNPPQKSGAPLKLAPSCCQNRFVTLRPTPNC
jgi:hypothetical protein